MRPQIKVKELPVGYLVLDYHVPSGPADFMTSKVLHKKIKEPCKNCQDCLDDMKNTWEFSGSDDCKHKKEKIHSYNKKIGTKHIQLVAANANIFETKKGFGIRSSLGSTYDFPESKVHECNNIMKQGKDFFIYKLTEVKNGKI